ncbi:RNA polymerase sigma factor [Limisalsivibrio acetivorans]|uniref:RNA polymerase sigma factor n=1 Tax=Limisalsivibrio acetivorans TaxID=1304888 RepID=UPI0003B741AE|nr:RNA polymerase sigma factor [Limisalsivibrio acetivorans]
MRNNRALQEFFEGESGRLYGYLIKLCGDEDEAKDLYQESFIKYARNYPEKLSASLLFTVARTVFIDSKRKEKRHDEIPDELSCGESPEERLLENRRQKALSDCLGNLPESEREIIALKTTEGLKYDDISKITGLSTSSIKVKIHRARLKLRDCMAEKDNG